jgi:hypothetical protein
MCWLKYFGAAIGHALNLATGSVFNASITQKVHWCEFVCRLNAEGKAHPMIGLSERVDGGLISSASRFGPSIGHRSAF